MESLYKKKKKNDNNNARITVIFENIYRAR